MNIRSLLVLLLASSCSSSVASSDAGVPDASSAAADAGGCTPACLLGEACAHGNCAPCDCAALQCGNVCGRSCGECVAPKTCNSNGLCEGGGSPCDGVVCQPGEACESAAGICRCTTSSCLGNQVCNSSGRCACTVGEVLCGSNCVNTEIDPQNCGSCGNGCSGGTGCIDGRCLLPDAGAPGADAGTTAGFPSQVLCMAHGWQCQLRFHWQRTRSGVRDWPSDAPPFARG